MFDWRETAVTFLDDGKIPKLKINYVLRDRSLDKGQKECLKIPSIRAQQETEPDRFSINRKPTDSRFFKDWFSVFLILVNFGFKTRFFVKFFLL
jgi:hypothetical protein